MTLSCDDVRDLAAGFVLGALDAADMAAVREHLATCPEAHAEVVALGGVVAHLDDSLEPVEPPASLRARLLAAAAAELPGATEKPAAAPARGPAAAAAPESAPAAPPATRSAAAGELVTNAGLIPFPAAERAERPGTRLDRRAGWGLRIAAVLVIALLGTWNLQLQANLSGARSDLAAARAYQQGVAAVLDVGTRSGAQTAFLAAAEPGLGSSGVAAAAPDGTVVMAIHGLAPTAGSQVYEAWVIVGKNAPVAIGGFTVQGDGTGVLRTSTPLAKPGAVLALTLEPLPAPTAPAGPVVTAGSLVAPTS